MNLYFGGFLKIRSTKTRNLNYDKMNPLMAAYVELYWKVLHPISFSNPTLKAISNQNMVKVIF